MPIMPNSTQCFCKFWMLFDFLFLFLKVSLMVMKLGQEGSRKKVSQKEWLKVTDEGPMERAGEVGKRTITTCWDGGWEVRGRGDLILRCFMVHSDQKLWPNQSRCPSNPRSNTDALSQKNNYGAPCAELPKAAKSLFSNILPGLSSCTTGPIFPAGTQRWE